MQINNKFNIGDEVYTVVEEPISVICPVCNGSKRIIYNNFDLYCPNCIGQGRQTFDKTLLTVSKGKLKIKSMRVHIYGDRTLIKYRLEKLYDDAFEKNINNRIESSLFRIKEEAEEYCKKINQERSIKNEGE